MIAMLPTTLFVIALLALAIAFQTLCTPSKLRRRLVAVICRFRPHLRSPFSLYRCDRMYLSQCSRCGCLLERRRCDGLWHAVDV